MRTLLEEHCPDLASGAPTRLTNSGTSNAMWRLRSGDGVDAVVRLPRTASAIASVEREIELLPQLAESPIAELVRTPIVIASGHDASGRPWMVLDWIEGDDAWNARSLPSTCSVEMAQSMARVVAAIVDSQDLPGRVRRAGARGGPLTPVLAGLERWLGDWRWSASSLVDVAAVRRVAAMCAEVCADVADEQVGPVFAHGDLIPGNVLLRDGSLSAVIDWGGAGYADPAQDLAPAWSMFDGRARDAFCDAIDVDESAWIRVVAFELEQAVGGVLYYVPRRHPLGDVMQRTLDRILAAY